MTILQYDILQRRNSKLVYLKWLDVNVHLSFVIRSFKIYEEFVHLNMNLEIEWLGIDILTVNRIRIIEVEGLNRMRIIEGYSKVKVYVYK